MVDGVLLEQQFGLKKAQTLEPRVPQAFEIKCLLLVLAALRRGLLDLIETSARSRNQAKDVRPILLNNAGPNALHRQ